MKHCNSIVDVYSFKVGISKPQCCHFNLFDLYNVLYLYLINLIIIFVLIVI